MNMISNNHLWKLSLFNNSTLAFRLTLFVFGVYMSNTSIVNQYKQEIFLHVNQISWFEDANNSLNILICCNYPNAKVEYIIISHTILNNINYSTFANDYANHIRLILSDIIKHKDKKTRRATPRNRPSSQPFPLYGEGLFPLPLKGAGGSWS